MKKFQGRVVTPGEVTAEAVVTREGFNTLASFQMALQFGDKEVKCGDQSNKELCIRSWYTIGWDCVLRPKTKEIAEKSAQACEKGCANNNIGYDQNQRNTLNTQARKVNYDLSKIKTKCETDCSAFMTVCAIAGGANIDYGSNGPTTSTIKSAFKNTGKFTVLTDSKYLTSTPNSFSAL